MAVARVARSQPLTEESVPVNNAALVVGGGVAGMTAALALADQGFPVHLVEKSSRLGGTALELHHTLDSQWSASVSPGGHAGCEANSDIQSFLAETIDRVTHHPRITVHLQTHASKVAGHVGNFTSTLTGVQTGVAANVAGTRRVPEDADGTRRVPATIPGVEVKHGVVVVATGAMEQKPAELRLRPRPRAWSRNWSSPTGSAGAGSRSPASLRW